jgi:hypothetical protein
MTDLAPTPLSAEYLECLRDSTTYIAAMSPDVTLTLVAELRTLRAALGDAEIWFQAEADHPRPDPRPAMAAQAVIIRDLLAALDATREETT